MNHSKNFLRTNRLQETSVVANEHNKSSGIKKNQIEKLRTLYEINLAGLTDFEVAQAMNIPCAIASARRNDLSKICNVVLIGKRKNPKTKMMNNVWTIVSHGTIFSKPETPKERLDEILRMIERWEAGLNSIPYPKLISWIKGKCKI